MSSPLESLVAAGTKLWLDSIDPDLVASNRALGATGATSNPVIVSDLIKTGRFDEEIEELIGQGKDDDSIAWELTDTLVKRAQEVFLPVWEESNGNDGYVSFELDPLLEDPERDLPHGERVAQYVELGKKWAEGHTNRMIKVPATPAGLDSLEALSAAGITLNVTLIFSDKQYRQAREAIWKGALQRDSLDKFKSVYSIFVSRLDVYTEQHAADLSAAAQGQVGIVNAKRIWAENKSWWNSRPTALQQEMIFASTGTKKSEDPAWKYVEAFAGSDIETNPPGTNDKVQASGRTIEAHVCKLPADEVLIEIDRKVDMDHLEKTLMEEGIAKFAGPQKALLSLIADKRKSLSAAS
ncbi:Transaldolase [Planctomycetales bacterium 10988]|nr:Transaldolase [Planctomycetales bacterium 10988]